MKKTIIIDGIKYELRDFSFCRGVYKNVGSSYEEITELSTDIQNIFNNFILDNEKIEANKNIYLKLEELDKKKIRAISDAVLGDDTFLHKINAEQEALREQLKQ